MKVEVNNGKQDAKYRNGKYEYTFTPKSKTDKVKLYHMGCNGTTQLSRIQLERGEDVTTFERPYEKANSLSGIFKQLRDLDIEMRDENSEFWGRLKLNNKGLLTEFQNKELKTLLASTAEGVSTQVKKEIKDSVTDQINSTAANLDVKFNQINSSIQTIESGALKKSEISISENGISLGSGKEINGKVVSSLLTASPDGIKAITDRLVLSPNYDNLVINDYRKKVNVGATGKIVTPKITDDNLKVNDTFKVIGTMTQETRDVSVLLVNLVLEYEDGTIEEQAGRCDISGSGDKINNFNETIRVLESSISKEKKIKGYYFELNQSENAAAKRVITDFKIYKQRDAELIVDGTIKSRHIGAEEIKAGNIKAGNIKAEHIGVNAIRAEHVYMDEALVKKIASNYAFIDELFAKNAFIRNLNAVKIKTTQLEGDTIDGVMLTGRSQIRIGANGYLEPFKTGMRFVLPIYNYATSGVGIQFNATANELGKGISVFNIPDINQPNSPKPVYDEVLMTVHGQIRMGFPFFDNKVGKFSNLIGSVVVSNISNNNPVTPWGYRGNLIGEPTFSKISWMSWLWGAEGGARIVFGYPYDNNVNYMAVRVGESFSDQKLKENIAPTTAKALDLIKKLQFKEFTWKKEYKETGGQKPVKLGLIAQDVQKLDDSLVTKSPDILEIEHFRLSMYAIKGIQELMEQNKELLQKIERLEEKINGK